MVSIHLYVCLSLPDRFPGGDENTSAPKKGSCHKPELGLYLRPTWWTNFSGSLTGMWVTDLLIGPGMIQKQLYHQKAHPNTHDSLQKLQPFQVAPQVREISLQLSWSFVSYPTAVCCFKNLTCFSFLRHVTVYLLSFLHLPLSSCFCCFLAGRWTPGWP